MNFFTLLPPYSIQIVIIPVNLTLFPIDFREILNEFDDVIEKASFFSIDAEFTGLNNERTCPFNTPSELYKKICNGTNDYIIIQLGITAFRQCTGNSAQPRKLKTALNSILRVLSQLCRKCGRFDLSQLQLLCVSTRAGSSVQMLWIEHAIFVGTKFRFQQIVS